MKRFDYRKKHSRAAQISFGLSGRFKIQVVEAGRIVEDRPWQKNLILDQGLDQVATIKFADLFLRCAAGTGNTPTSDDSGAETAAQVGTALTLSNTVSGMAAGRIIRWDAGGEARIVSGSGTSWVASPSQSVASGQFTIYRVDQTGLTTEVSGTSGRTSTYLTGSGNSETTVDNALGIMKHKRTFDFAAPASNTNYAEIGVANSATQASNLFSRMLITGGTVTVTTAQQLRVIYELWIYVSPITPSAKTASISGWSSTDGDEQWQLWGLGKIDTAGGATVAGYDSGFAAMEPSTQGENGCSMFISPVSTALSSFASGATRATNSTGIVLTKASYTAGSFTMDKSGTYTTGQANRADYRSIGIMSGTTSQGTPTFVFLFDNAMEKTSLHTLSLTWRWTWGRNWT